MRGTSRPKAVATEVQSCHPQLGALEGLETDSKGLRTVKSTRP